METTTAGSNNWTYSGYWTCGMCHQEVYFGDDHTCNEFQNSGTIAITPYNSLDNSDPIIQKLDKIIKLLEELSKV